MYKILIVEDDETIAYYLQKHLKSWNFNVHVVQDFQNVMIEFNTYEPHLVLLDISLPFFNGFHWCNEIRKNSQVPIIFISSNDDNMNIVMAMNMGADDFVNKPFELEVLTAKISALLRRTYDFGTHSKQISYQGLELNLDNATVSYHDELIDLTKNDYLILKLLLENIGKIVSREKLMLTLWETDSYIDENTLTVNISRIRKKLSDIGLDDFIQTKKGIGYIVE